MKIRIINRKNSPDWIGKLVTPPGHYFWLPNPKAWRWAFTARLIFEHGQLNFLNERSRLTGKDSLPLNNWLKLTEKALEDHQINNTMNSILHIETGDHVLIASPNASYGYLYLSLWEKQHATKNH